jgi:hypothetical protein
MICFAIDFSPRREGDKLLPRDWRRGYHHLWLFMERISRHIYGIQIVLLAKCRNAHRFPLICIVAVFS